MDNVSCLYFIRNKYRLQYQYFLWKKISRKGKLSTIYRNCNSISCCCGVSKFIGVECCCIEIIFSSFKNRNNWMCLKCTYLKHIPFIIHRYTKYYSFSTAKQGIFLKHQLCDRKSVYTPFHTPAQH